MIARISTPWAGDGHSLATSYHPRLLDDHPLPAGALWQDVSGGKPPNPYTVEVRGVDQGWVTTVSQDATYTVLSSQ